MRKYLVLLALAIFCMQVKAQKPDTTVVKSAKDSLNRKRDSLTSKSILPLPVKPKKAKGPDSTHSVRKAVIRSLIIPGWGQIYNRKAWKVPIIYGGLAALGLAVEYNLRYYNKYLNEARARQNGNSGTGEFAAIPGDATQFFNAASANQRNFQLSILGILGVWGINCIDAYIDAKFIHSYTVDDDLTFHIKPTLINQPVYAGNFNAFAPGVKLTFAF